jgi:hypothetical protein
MHMLYRGQASTEGAVCTGIININDNTIGMVGAARPLRNASLGWSGDRAFIIFKERIFAAR